MKFLSFFSILFLISFVSAYAASHPEYSGIDNPSEYVLNIDDHTFSFKGVEIVMPLKKGVNLLPLF